tara:strand:- start:1466 stop:2590 length:1125 start_codon:yes stop_codon:yes gene_type:complete
MILRFFVLWILLHLLQVVVDARPYAAGLDRSENIEFDQRWNKDLEVEESHPLSSYKKPYWQSKRTHHLNALDKYDRRLIRPLRQVENGLEISTLYLYSSNLDVNLAFPNPIGAGGSPAAGEGTVRFDTRGLAHELKARFPAFGYNLFSSIFLFHPEDQIAGPQRNVGYNLSFGNTVSEYSGLSKSTFNLYKVGNERFLGKKKESRFSILMGVSHLNFRRFERLRGQDRLGINQATSNILPNDPIIIEQGEYTLDKNGTGAFVGLKYHSHLGGGLSWLSSLSYHGLKTDQFSQNFLQRVSQQGLLEQSTNRLEREQTDGIIDFEFKFQKYLRHFYNVSVGYRYIQYLEKPRQAIDSINRDKFAMKGIQLSLQRFF